MGENLSWKWSAGKRSRLAGTQQRPYYFWRLHRTKLFVFYGPLLINAQFPDKQGDNNKRLEKDYFREHVTDGSICISQKCDLSKYHVYYLIFTSAVRRNEKYNSGNIF